MNKETKFSFNNNTQQEDAEKGQKWNKYENQIPNDSHQERNKNQNKNKKHRVNARSCKNWHSTYHRNDRNYQNMKTSASDDTDGLQNPDKNTKAGGLESV